MSIKEINNPNYEFLLKNAVKLQITKIDMEMYKNILLIYDSSILIGLINYCIIPSMKGKEKLFIKNLYSVNNDKFSMIIKLLCKYCKKKNYSILTTLTDKDVDIECINAFYKNNFHGENLTYHV